MTEFKNMLKNEDFHTVIINELREIGVKYKEKKCKLSQEKECQKKVFQTPLHMLEVANVILCDGSAVLVPKFLADACNRILQNVEAEGIFRKAGSSLRQKEIRNGLEAGLPINRTHHVIDIANVLKYFFRELPEPLIPQSLHEPLLRAMMLGANNLKAILLICLLVPQLTLNTLSFFMQFLKTVASNSDSNKMTSGNLAIIFAPGIMPYSDIRSPRFNNHVKLVQMLIDNANMIGSIPSDIIKKFQQFEILHNGSPTKICRTIDITQKKKKNRRSEMFSGIRKIVESALGSAENLDESSEKIKLGNSETFTNPVQNIIQRKNEHMLHGTPCTKSSKKRKFPDTSTAFSVRKNLLPSNSGGLFPTTPFTKDYKKTRSSLCGNRQPRNDIVNPEGSSMERRWSFVGSGWNKLKPKHGPAKDGLDCTDGDFHTCSKNIFRHDVINEKVISSYFAVNNKAHNINGKLNQNRNGEFSTLSQNDFDDITERVQAIENRITKEFEKLRESLNSKTEMLNYSHNSVINAESVQNKYERIKTETVPLCSPSTDLLAKRLSRDLNIRKSIDKKILRSPSARKIGTLRKRSQETSKISRNKSWHTNSKSLHLVKTVHVSKDNDLNNALDLKIMSPALLINDQKSRFLETKFDTSPTFGNENWTSADIFFKGKQEQKETSTSEKTKFVYKTPQKQKLYSNPSVLISTNCPPTTVFHTPMLPPKSISHRTSQRNSEIKSNSNNSNTIFAKKSLMYTPFEEDGSGRASIARLRTQNAGMVMAKAKLFDDMGNESVDNSLKGTSTLKESSSIRSGSGPFVFMPASRKNEKVQQTVKNGCNSSTLNVQKNRKKLPGTKTKEEKRSTIVKRNLAVSPGFVKKDRCSARMTNKQLVSFLTTNEK